MGNSDKIIGATFLILAVVNLFLRDLLGFGLLAAAGVSLLIDEKRSQLARTLQIVFGAAAVILLVARAVVFLAR